MPGHILTFALLLCAFAILTPPAKAEEQKLDLTQAVVVTPRTSEKPRRNAIRLLVEEVEKRTRIHWKISDSLPSKRVPTIVVGSFEVLSKTFPDLRFTPSSSLHKAEGYQISVQGSQILVVGSDMRGMLFGVGRLLRNLHMERDSVWISASLALDSAPQYPLRGHQLGYRPKTNSYDAWSAPLWEQYIRDLAVFGTNAVELIPPKSDDDADSPHFPLPPMQMMIEMSRLLNDYGLDAWIWYPAMEKDYTDPKTVTASLKEWGEVFRKLPRVDAVFVPGGDPGHTAPRTLMTFLEKEAQVLRRYHPKAQMWVSPQGFTKAWMDEFLAILQKESPKWLTGIVFGPQVRLSLPLLRAAVPKQYPIRHYPDITHSRQCEYPVPRWDVAYALTEGREGINPRPLDQAQIFRTLQPDTIGFLTYSEGCNDDVNKIIWSALGWEQNTNVEEILNEYSRYFISERFGHTFAQGLLALEQNWRGSLAQNEGIYPTLELFQRMERSATPQERLNWRFQQALYRTYYDAHLRSRLLHEQEVEAQAVARLEQAGAKGSLNTLEEAEQILFASEVSPVKPEWRARVFELAEALFQSIRMQLSVTRYQAIGVERGANLDSIDVPLNNRFWLKNRFAEIRKLDTEPQRLQEIARIVHWTDPGAGGFYDELSNPLRRPHLVEGSGFQTDPGSYDSPRIGFSNGKDVRLSWLSHAETLYDTPLQMRYTHLDPNAHYRLRVVYKGDAPERKIRLVAQGEVEIHPPITKPIPTRPLEFDIPPQAIQKGELLLSWTGELGRGGNGRGCQVSEVWLLRVSQ